ncbi:MAG: histidine--tRNA ligase [Methanobrevibacter sp.]|jgi:histidyl-tRNA synthetase|nr:histidine--tRNA ligase [Methanobrevibacter sp.]
MDFIRPRGTRDFLFDEMANRKKVENILREVFENYAYKEVKTPIFENLTLFTNKSGDEIVKQLYNFKDKSNREIALRPEITAPIVRLYLNSLQRSLKPIKLYYFGSCFRYERPQKGRFRQFWQFGCELIGAKSPQSEAEIIAMAYDSLKKLYVNAEIHINHLGIIRGLFNHFKINEELQEHIMILIDKGDKQLLEDGINDLLKDNETFQEIILKLFDSIGNKNVLDDIEKYLKDYDNIKESLNELKKLTEMLAIFGVDNYKINLSVARGLDYYTKIVFEIYVPELKNQKQICGGGTYNLIKAFGGEDIQSTGFAFGFDRLMVAIKDLKSSSNLQVLVAPVSENTRLKSYEIAQTLRRANIKTETDLFNRKFKKILSFANSLNVSKVILVGEKDLEEGKVTVKNMDSGNQKLIPIEEIIDYIKENLD